jgi:hypothetical protein
MQNRESKKHKTHNRFINLTCDEINQFLANETRYFARAT